MADSAISKQATTPSAEPLILVVDDEYFLREVMREGLEGFGYRVIEAADGALALEAMRAQLPDLVLCDLRMPEMDGLAVLAAVRDQWPGLPVVVVTGAGAMADAVEALRLGAWDFIVKPVELGMVRHSIERALERQRLLRENQRQHDLLEETVRQRTAELQKRSQELEEANASLRQHIEERRQMETERAKLEADLRQAQKMEAIGTLASGVAHDFNNLLTAIIGNLSLLREESLTPSGHRFVAEAENACLRATGLVRQMLALSRRSKPDMHPIDVNATVEEVRHLVRETFDRRIEFYVDKADRLPKVLADHARINSLLLNLCVNARDAVMERLRLQTEGTPAPARITVSTRERWLERAQLSQHAGAKPGWYVVITVQDTGIGMEEEVRRRIFEPFFTTKPVDRGTGLGLSVVYGIVRQLEGWIDVQSRPMHGSSFTVFLPVAQQSAVEPLSDLSYRATAPGGTETLLVVDDEAGIREISFEYLSRLGYTVLLASDGQEGVRVFQEQQEAIDLLILDLSMPRVSGNEMLRQVRKLAPHVKAIISSGTADAPAHVTEPVDGFVLKPFRPTELAFKIREVLDQSRPQSIPVSS